MIGEGAELGCSSANLTRGDGATCCELFDWNVV